MKKLQTKLTALLVGLFLLAGFLPVTVRAAQPAVTQGDVYRTTRTQAVVEFTSDTAGAYYYTTMLPSEFSGDLNIDTTGEGVPCAAGEKVSVVVDGLTTDPYLFLLAVKGEDGTESQVLLVNIPEWDWWTLDNDWILHIESDKGLTNWNSFLQTQDALSQMLYKQYVVGVHIWKDVASIDGGSFPASEYPRLAAYTVEDGSAVFRAENGVLYNTGKTTLVAYPAAKADAAFTVPDTVATIGSKAFYGNTKVKNITADSVNIMSQAFAGSAMETFSANAVNHISDWAFRNCRKLTEVSVTGGDSFYIDMNAFENCTSLTSFPFEKISKTNHSVFKGCTSLTEIQVPNRIEGSVFAGCTGLTEITIPSTVTYIGWDAFDGCSNLVSVTFESATPPEIADTGQSNPFKPVQSGFRFHVPKGSEDAYIQALGEDMAPYILDGSTQFYPLYVNGVQVRSDNLTIACGDGTAVFDPDTSTLTLSDAEITKYGGKYGYGGAINSGLENLTIVLVGNNTINTGGDSINTGMACNLIIKGDGTLTANSQLDLGREPSVVYDGNNDTGDLTIDGATVNVGTYLFVHHNLTIKNGAAVNVTGKITANHQSAFTIDGADTRVTTDGISMGNGSQSDQTECRLVILGGTLTVRDGVAIPNPEDGDTNQYAIRFDPKEEGKIQLMGGSLITESDCKVTNALTENITVAETLEIQQGSWAGGNLKIGPHELTLVPGKPASCTDQGTRAYYTCSHCGKAFADKDGVTEIADPDTWKVIPALGHNPSSQWSSDAAGHWHACQNSGCSEKMDFAAHTPDHPGHATEEYAIKCSECGYVIEAQLGHTHVFDQEVISDAYKAADATCQAKAAYYKSCVCGQKGTETFTFGDLADHNPASDWSSDETGHWHACQTSGCTEKIDFAVHTPDHTGHATEDYAIKCTECGFVIEAQLGHTHVFDQEIATDAYKAADATCQAKAAYYKSCVCGQKGTETFFYGDLADHDFQWVIDKEATAAEKGSRHEECTVCGYRKAAVEIPLIETPAKTPAESTNADDSGNPPTGDSTNWILWIAVLFASAGILGVMWTRKKVRCSKKKE